MFQVMSPVIGFDRHPGGTIAQHKTRRRAVGIVQLLPGRCKCPRPSHWSPACCRRPVHLLAGSIPETSVV